MCLTADNDDVFQLILHDDNRIAIDLFFVCGIVVGNIANKPLDLTFHGGFFVDHRICPTSASFNMPEV